MTNKKRLEEIEKNLDPLGYGMGGHLISVNDIYWLVRYAKEQAERVQELEEEIRRIRQMKYHEAYEQGKFDTNMKVWYEVPELEQQNKRYRTALEFYADRENYKPNHYDPNIHEYISMIDYDDGATARKALEG